MVRVAADVDVLEADLDLTEASALRLLSSKDPGIEVRYLDPAQAPPRGVADGEDGRAVLVIVSRGEGVRVPDAWKDDLTPVFASRKPDGALADEIYQPTRSAAEPSP